jgi:serine protease Do
LTFAPLALNSRPAVVNIFTRKFVRLGKTSQFLEEPIVRRLLGDRFGEVGRGERVEAALGSGVIVRSDGIIVTSNHVISGARDILIALADRRQFAAQVLLQDSHTDLAVLKIETGGRELAHMELAEGDDLRVGDFVLAIGNPFGVGRTVTMGIVSALARTAVGISDFSFFIQTDAAINPGNSGGALIDLKGRLVGINTAIFSRTAGSVGIGFAVPASMVRATLNAVLSAKPLVRPWIGVSGRTLPPQVADMLGFDYPFGVMILNVHPEAPFALAGGRPGDIVLAMDGREIEDWEALRFHVATRPVGSSLRLAVWRSWATQMLDIELTPPPELPSPETRRLRGYQPLSGARVASLSPALAERLAVDSSISGIVVLDIARGSAAARSGLRRHDILAAVNGEAVAKTSDLDRFLRRPYPGWEVTLRRGDELLAVKMSMVRP